MFLSNIYRYLFPLSEYARLKEKYAAKIISNWQESSDPEKSVHEDLGIAAYLSCLWQGKHTSFVDLGCGNGLLVFILTSEASPALGAVWYRTYTFIMVDENLNLIKAVVSQKFLPVIQVAPSVVDPHTLNFDPDPGFWANLDPDPGLCYQF